MLADDMGASVVKCIDGYGMRWNRDVICSVLFVVTRFWIHPFNSVFFDRGESVNVGQNRLY